MATPEELELQKQAAAKKAAEEKEAAEAAAKKKAEEDAEKVDPTIKAILDGGPDAVQALIEKKRAANEEAKKYRLQIETQEKEKAEQEKKRLEDEGKFKELAEKEKVEKEALQEKTKTLFIDRALEKAAVKEGAVDADAAVALADRSKVTIDEAYNVTGADESIKALMVSKPFLFDEENKPENPPPGEGSPKPGLRDKVNVTSDDKRSPHEKASSYFNKSKKERDKDKK